MKSDFAFITFQVILLPAMSPKTNKLWIVGVTQHFWHVRQNLIFDFAWWQLFVTNAILKFRMSDACLAGWNSRLGYSPIWSQGWMRIPHAWIPHKLISERKITCKFSYNIFCYWCINLTRIRKVPQYQISWKSVQLLWICYMMKNRHTDMVKRRIF
jgi:hypothetical protein